MCGTRSDARPIFFVYRKIDVRKCVPKKKVMSVFSLARSLQYTTTNPNHYKTIDIMT